VSATPWPPVAVTDGRSYYLTDYPEPPMDRDTILTMLIDIYIGNRKPIILEPRLAKRLFEELTGTTFTAR
jgi:hypothetical protein